MTKLKTIVCLCAMMFSVNMFAENETSNEVEEKDNTLEAPESVCNDEAFTDGNYWTLQEAFMPSKDKEWKRDAAVTTPKFGGYIIGSYKFDDSNDQTKGDGFGLRLIRLYVDGTVFKDFKYRLQMEVNNTPHVKDATIEWVHYKGFQVKVGQFKRCFTFENPYNPWNVGFGDYSQLVKKLAGMGDRCGEASVGGRDLGLQFQGNLFKAKSDGHYQLQYQLGVFNGQGINTKDLNKQKDFIGNIQWTPIKNLTLGAFGWTGKWYSSDKKINLDRKRYAFSVKYEDDKSGWSARAEYAHSTGRKASDWDAVNQCWNANAQNEDLHNGNKADAWYVAVGVPVWRWIKCYAKYDAYRDYATNSTMHSIYSVSCNLQPHNNLMLQLQYNYNDDKTASAPKRHYNQLWAQMYIRF